MYILITILSYNCKVETKLCLAKYCKYTSNDSCVFFLQIHDVKVTQ